MKKTSVYLSEQDREHLERVARSLGQSQSEAIREALRAFEAPCPPVREFASFDCGEGPGNSIENIPEEEYLKGFGE